MVVSVSLLLPTAGVTKGESCISFVLIDEGGVKVNLFFLEDKNLKQELWEM